ncbi:hypothetical protein [Caproicibacter sp. BJN0012]|uniref:hypothetical protein n=1 Tax=Caproicibacter sp. BJN0012 TaxID=3110227 RepID=UPI002E1141F7
MQNESFEKAVESFMAQRIADCGMRGSDSLQEAYQQFEQAVRTLKSMLTPEQAKTFVKLEDAYSLVDGETTNCYYRAGFSDAVQFLLGWRDGKWK